MSGARGAEEERIKGPRPCRDWSVAAAADRRRRRHRSRRTHARSVVARHGGSSEAGGSGHDKSDPSPYDHNDQHFDHHHDGSGVEPLASTVDNRAHDQSAQPSHDHNHDDETTDDS
jgi:hypothetical protein